MEPKYYVFRLGGSTTPIIIWRSVSDWIPREGSKPFFPQSVSDFKPPGPGIAFLKPVDKLDEFSSDPCYNILS